MSEKNYELTPEQEENLINKEEDRRIKEAKKSIQEGNSKRMEDSYDKLKEIQNWKFRKGKENGDKGGSSNPPPGNN